MASTLNYSEPLRSSHAQESSYGWERGRVIFGRWYFRKGPNIVEGAELPRDALVASQLLHILCRVMA